MLRAYFKEPHNLFGPSAQLAKTKSALKAVRHIVLNSRTKTSCIFFNLSFQDVQNWTFSKILTKNLTYETFRTVNASYVCLNHFKTFRFHQTINGTINAVGNTHHIYTGSISTLTTKTAVITAIVPPIILVGSRNIRK